MSNLKDRIKELVSEYIVSKPDTWVAGEDWIKYSGPHYDEKEYIAAIDVLIDGWLISGENAREYEKQFPSHLGMKYGSLTNSGSSANLLAVSALKSK